MHGNSLTPSSCLIPGKDAVYKEKFTTEGPQKWQAYLKNKDMEIIEIKSVTTVMTTIFTKLNRRWDDTLKGNLFRAQQRNTRIWENEREVKGIRDRIRPVLPDWSSGRRIKIKWSRGDRYWGDPRNDANWMICEPTDPGHITYGKQDKLKLNPCLDTLHWKGKTSKTERRPWKSAGRKHRSPEKDGWKEANFSAEPWKPGDWP